MSDPQNMDEYLAVYTDRCYVDGYGINTTQVFACPFCAAKDWLRCKIVNVEKDMAKGETCSNCGRSAKFILKNEKQGKSFELVQTGGPDAPDWLVPKIRRVNT